MTKKREKEIILNVPNALTILRFILTFVIIYMIFTGVKLSSTLIVFVIAAFTDFLDGQIARRYNQVTEFGRRADMIADRFLWIGTALAFIISFGFQGILTYIHGMQFLMIYMRELISAPFAISAFFSAKKNALPDARYIAKVTTVAQGFALPILIISVYYPNLVLVSLPLSLVTLILGTISAKMYMKDVNKKNS